MLKLLLRLILKALFRIKTVGTFKADAERIIIISNHQSFLDGFLLGVMLPVKPIFVINTEIAKRPLMRLFLSISDFVAINPTNPMGIKQIVRLVESGRPIVIFPEGRITTTGSLMKIYEGSAFVAAKTGATIVPVIIEGATFSTLSRMHSDHPKEWFPKLTLTYLPSTKLEISDDATTHKKREMAAEAMRALLQRSIYQARTPNTIFGAFLAAAKSYGYKRKIVEDTKLVEYSYAQLLTMSLGLARLLGRHTTKDEAVGVLLPTAVGSLATVLGLNATSRVAAMLNFTAGSDALQSACTAACIKTVVTSRAFIEQAKLEDKLATLRGVKIIFLEELRKEMSMTDKLWLMGFARWFPTAATIKSAPKDRAVILFTSGSEGKPKGVVLSNDALLANIAQARSIVDFSTDDKVLNAMPIFHSFGLTAGTLLPILSGMPLFLYPSPLHYKVIPEVAYDRSCTVLFGTSTFLGNYAKHAHPYDFYRLRFVIAGAERLSLGVRDLWFEKFGIRIYEGYGATETAPIIAVNTPMAYRSGTVGQILPGIEHRLLPVAGVADGGVLHVRGDNLMSGYLREQNAGVLERPSSEAGNGWYDTGDIVTIDKDGFVSIAGRVKRFAKVAGEMISLESVENLALTASPAHQHAASSRSDESRGELIVLFTTDENLKRDALLVAAKNGGYPEIAIPKKIVTLSAIPLLGTGKTDYATLKEMKV